MNEHAPIVVREPCGCIPALVSGEWRVIWCRAHKVAPMTAKGLRAVEALINESRGVGGLHLNGDLATWDELRSGGTFQEWLADFDAALKEIDG